MPGYTWHSAHSKHPYMAALTGLCLTPDAVTSLALPQVDIYKITMPQGLCTCSSSSWNPLPTEGSLPHLLHVSAYVTLLERTSLATQYKIAVLSPYLHHPPYPVLFFSIVHITT